MSFKFSMKYIFILLLILIFMSCKDESQLEQEIAKINTNITVERFDKYVSQASLHDFPKLKKAYPFMFSARETDATWAETKKDTLQIQLFQEVDKTFSTFNDIEREIESLFNHLKHYFPEFKTPRVITTTNFVRYRDRVIVTDTIALIALDSYLGSNHKFYGNIPKFITSNLKKEQIVVNLTEEYAEKFIYNKQKKTLLDEMIHYGKQLYFKDVIIPFKSEAERINYSQEELSWARSNESYIWRYFVERELLYSTDSKLPSRFINPGPFSKFYLEEIDTDSPGRLGQYIGWQIVKAYMNHNDVSLKEMLKTSTEDIFNNSKFKPSK